MSHSKSVWLKNWKGIDVVLVLLLLYVLSVHGKDLALHIPFMKPMIAKTEKNVELEIIIDTPSQRVWGLRFSSYYKGRNLEIEAVEQLRQHYWSKTTRFLKFFYQGHSMDSDGKRHMLLYFAEPVSTAVIPPKYEFVFRELKDQTLPSGCRMKIVPVDSADSSLGYKLMPK